MKTILMFLITLASASSFAEPKPYYAEEPALSIGTYQKGNNVTEPRPAESKYLRTSMGGFQLIQSYAGYKVFIDVIQDLDKRYYTRAVLQNPLDPQAPFVYEHYLDPGTPSTTLTHGPVKGLQVYKDYQVEFILYSDDTRTNEVDRLTQKIRSYVDTTGDQLFLYDRIKEK